MLKLNLAIDREAAPAHARARAAIAAVALRTIEERTTDPLDGAIAADMVREYRDRAGWLVRVHENAGAVRGERAARLALRRDALAASRTELLRLHRSSEIEDDALRTLEQELDLDEIKLRSQIGAD